MPFEIYGRNGASLIVRFFKQNFQFLHSRLQSLEHINVLVIIYQSEHYSLIFGPYGCHIIFTKSPLFVYISIFCKYTLHVCYVFNVILRILVMTDSKEILDVMWRLAVVGTNVETSVLLYSALIGTLPFAISGC